jgi:hypothetical protein
VVGVGRARVRGVQVLTLPRPGARIEVARFRTVPPDPTDHAPAAIRAEIAGWRAAVGLPPLADVGAAPCAADEASDGTRLTRTWRCWSWPANPAQGGGVAWGEVSAFDPADMDGLRDWILSGALLGPGTTWFAVGFGSDGGEAVQAAVANVDRPGARVDRRRRGRVARRALTGRERDAPVR